MRILEERIFLTPMEVSLLLGVSRSYVYRLVQEQRLLSTTVKPVRIPTDSFKAYLTEIVPQSTVST